MSRKHLLSRKNLLIVFAILSILIGIYLKEPEFVYNYAKKICFSCMGFG